MLWCCSVASRAVNDDTEVADSTRSTTDHERAIRKEVLTKRQQQTLEELLANDPILHPRRTTALAGERTAWHDPKRIWPMDQLLRPHIRACLSGIQFETYELQQRDTGFSVCTLGTGAGTGSVLRSNTATVVKHGGDSYLVDAGEGLQRQFESSRIKARDVRKVFST